MQDDAVEIESNMMASGKLKAKLETRNRETKHFREQVGPSGSNRSADDRVDDMARVIKELSNKISRMELEQAKDDSYPKKDFKRNPNPPNQQRQIKNEDQKIQAPLKNENFIGANDFQDFGDSDNDVTNLGANCTQPYLTREDYGKSLNTPQPLNKGEEGDHSDLCESQPETEMLMAEFQPKYNLRSKSKPTSTTQPKKILQRGQAYEPPSEETLLPNNKMKMVRAQESEVEKVETQAQGTKPVNKVTSSTKTMSDKAVQTNKSERKDLEVSTKETDKVSGNFSFEYEINKIKIPIPLVELAKNPVYQKQITKAMGISKLESQYDVLNLEDDKPNITFGPHFEGAKDTIAPFYITLNVYDQLLHNCMLDSGASHNVMPKIIMDKLGLHITRTYGDLYSFDSIRVKCMGMIKYLVVTLVQVPVKSIPMDVVIEDIPPKYGLLLSRSWGSKLGGYIQLEMTYSKIHVFGGQFTWL
jgi:hypothetical protein